MAQHLPDWTIGSIVKKIWILGMGRNHKHVDTEIGWIPSSLALSPPLGFLLFTPHFCWFTPHFCLSPLLAMARGLDTDKGQSSLLSIQPFSFKVLVMFAVSYPTIHIPVISMFDLCFWCAKPLCHSSFVKNSRANPLRALVLYPDLQLSHRFHLALGRHTIDGAQFCTRLLLSLGYQKMSG